MPAATSEGVLERLAVAVARRVERPAQALLARRRLRSLLRRRAERAWRSADAPLIVCYGNINRSAFAGGLTRLHGRPEARSGGFHPAEGRPAPAATVAQARRYGVDLSAHRSCHVGRAELAGARAIFAFDLENVARIAVRDPTALARTHLIGVLDDDAEVLIRDPHGRSEAVLEATLARIARAVKQAELAS